MMKRICPICEQVMRGKHYCSQCRSFVRHPRMANVDYYLNERHLSGETVCEYHNPPVRGTAQRQKGQPSPAKQPAGSYPPSAKQPAARQPAGRWPQRSRGEAAGWGNIGTIIVTIFLILFAVNFLLPLLFLIL